MDPSFGKFIFPISDLSSTYRHSYLRSGHLHTIAAPHFSECALPPAGCPLDFRAQPHTKKLSEATFECSEARNPPRIANLEISNLDSRLFLFSPPTDSRQDTKSSPDNTSPFFQDGSPRISNVSFYCAVHRLFPFESKPSIFSPP